MFNRNNEVIYKMNGPFIAGHIRKAHSRAQNPKQAVQEFHTAVSSAEMALVIFFCSSRYDLDVIAEEINAHFGKTRVIGCTTAGEIGPAGYCGYSLSGLSFPASDCSAVSAHLEHLSELDPVAANALVGRLLRELGTDDAGAAKHRFAFQLIDGLCGCEETVTHAFQHALGDIALLGGSSGDDLQIEQTWVFSEGVFRRDAAALAVIETVYPFTLFKTQSFVGGHERLVVTRADAAKRIVYEINGEPAAQAYARASGVTVDRLGDRHFSDFPVVVRINGMDYMRSIQKVNPDGSLTFYCAIDRGIIFRVGHSIDFIGNLESVFEDVHAKVGDPQLVIACDCVLRQLEMNQNSEWKARAEDLFKKNNAVGFSTYGEQFMGMHMNQTLTGIAIGYGGEAYGT